MRQIKPKGQMSWQCTVLLDQQTGVDYQAYLQQAGRKESEHIRTLVKSHLAEMAAGYVHEEVVKCD